MKHFVVALSVLAIAAPSLALAASDADGYPPGLFEHSPLIDSNHPAKSNHSHRLQKTHNTALLAVPEELERVARAPQSDPSGGSTATETSGKVR